MALMMLQVKKGTQHTRNTAGKKIKKLKINFHVVFTIQNNLKKGCNLGIHNNDIPLILKILFSYLAFKKVWKN